MKGKLTVLVITAFVDMLGLAMIVAMDHLGLGFRM